MVGTVKTFVSATLDHQSHGLVFNTISSNQDARLSELEKIQNVERRCTLVNYTIFHPIRNDNLSI